MERLKAILEDIHTNFKDHVSPRRAGKLPEDQDLFTGEIWLAKRAKDAGSAGVAVASIAAGVAWVVILIG